MKSKARSVQAYVAACPPESRKALKELRTLVKASVPGATEKISYGIIKFVVDGKGLLHIAGWKKHVSVYAVTAGVARELRQEIKTYQTGRGTLQFPLARPLPKGLIRRIVKVRVGEVAAAERAH